jgi:hypothetical protein
MREWKEEHKLMVIGEQSMNSGFEYDQGKPNW